ncbi:hypothetical protein MHBO_001197 [Bonamia ostreae]|uniref:Uncharacterized protein n=1 Tax=Bonamia ostreae TaxID=126728 RepID=A0ABV2AI47_9EUKA
MHKWRQFEHKPRSLQDVKEVDIFYMDARSPYYFVQMIGSKQIHMARESNFPMEKTWVEFSYFLSQHKNSSIADFHIFIKTEDKIYMLLNPAKFVYRTDFINDEQIGKFNKDTFFDLEKKMLQHLGLERQLSWVANNDIVITQEGKLLLVNLSWKKDNFDEVIDYVSQRAKIEVEEITEFIFPHSIALDCITSLDIFQHIAFFDKKVFVKTVRCSRTGEFYLQTDYFVSGNNDIKKFLQSTGKYTEAEIFVWENKDRDNHNFLLPYSKYSGLTFPYFIRKFDAEDLSFSYYILRKILHYIYSYDMAIE